MAELSGLEVMALVKEVAARLEGAYVSAVYSVGSNQVIRFRHPGGVDTWLVASPRYGVWVSEKVAERAETTEFTSKLRGEIERARFVSAEQPDLDRVFDLTLGEGEFLRHLVVEMMPPGNIIVTDGDRKIRLVLREVRSERRKVSRGGVYSPPQQGRESAASVTAQKVAEMLHGEKTVGRAIGRNVALPRKYVQEVLRRLSSAESTPSTELLGREDEVSVALRGLVEEARMGTKPSIRETPEGDEIFVVTPAALPVKQQGGSVSELCDALFLSPVMGEVPERKSPEEGKRKEVEATIEKLKTQEESLRGEASDLRQLAERARAAPSLKVALELLGNAAASRGRARREAPTSKEAVASELYARAKGAEKRADDAVSAAAQLTRRLSTFKVTKEKQTRELSKRNQEWYEKFRWFFTSDGKLAIGGRDAQSNTLLIRRHLDDGDTVYHADLFGSPFFLLKGGKGQTAGEILEVAQATASFSSAWKTGLGSADAYWVEKDQVGTSAPSGEYLARGSFLIKGRKNMVPHNLVQLAIGVDEKSRIMSGPESAVAKAARCFVVLSPHREKPSDTAKRVAKELERLSGERLKVSIDDVLRAMPAGGGKVVSRAGKL